MKSLKDVLTYDNPRLIEKFREDYYFDKEEAEEILQEVLKWLWLAASENRAHMCGMYHPMLVMDKMWHTFLSFSKDYLEFCKSTLGQVIHHEPHTRGDAVSRMTISAVNPDPMGSITKEIGAFQELVYDKFGPDTLIKWFVTFPHVYSPEEMHRRTRPQFSQHGFQKILEMRAMSKSALLDELAKTHAIAAWCGGPGCGSMCTEA